MKLQKKIFVLTGEPSGDKLASKVISKIKNSKPDIEFFKAKFETFLSKADAPAIIVFELNKDK